MVDKVKIVKSDGTRILRPCEFRMLMLGIPKIDLKNKLEALLYSGCRYSELRWLWVHKTAFDEKGSIIHMPSMKPEAKHADRWIRLNQNGVRAVSYFLQSKNNLPAHNGWDEDLKRWCKEAGLDSEGITCKMTRKTWESWLATMYPVNFHNIILNQGHTEKVSLDYYLMLPFDEEDRREMHYYTDGWLR